MNQEKIERFALCQFLSEFPDKVEYKEVLRLIYEEDEEVTVWQPFEDFPAYKIVEFIEDMVISMNHWFKEEITND